MSESCSTVMRAGTCGRSLWKTHCILHDPDPHKPAAQFLSEIQRTVDRAAGQSTDLSNLHWHELPLDRISWSSTVSLVGSHFHGVTPFAAARFEGDVDLSNCTFDGVLVGAPVFAGRLSLRDSKFDGIRWENARFAGDCDLSGVQFWSDSYVIGCEFHKTLDLGRSSIWELHFSGCLFGSDLTFNGATGRISLRWFRTFPSSLDIAGFCRFHWRHFPQGSDHGPCNGKGWLRLSRCCLRRSPGPYRSGRDVRSARYRQHVHSETGGVPTRSD